MKKYTIKHTDGTTKQVFENELSQYGLELPKAKSGIKIKGKKLPKADGGVKTQFTQDAPQNNQYNFNQPNFTVPAQDFDNFDESEYVNGTYSPNQPRVNYQVDQLPPLYDFQRTPEQVNQLPNLQTQQLQTNDTPLTFNPNGATQNTKSGFNWTDGFGVASEANNLVRQGQMFTKKIASDIGNGLVNQHELARNSGQRGQFAYNKAENVRPYSLYGEGVGGSNALAENGTKVFGNKGITINDFKSENQNGQKNIEVEGLGKAKNGEFVGLPNGFGSPVIGAPHTKGGIEMNLPQDTVIFSLKNKLKNTPLLAPLLEQNLLKISDIGKSWSTIANKYTNTENEFKRLANLKSKDDISDNTINKLVKNKQAISDKLFKLHQDEKLHGFQGKEAQLEAIQSLQQEQQMQPGQEQNQQPIAKYGMKLPKFDVGGVNYAALSNVEKQLGVLKNGMPSSTGYDDKSIHQLDSKMVERIKGTIGEDTWNKLPDNLKTQVFSFAFNNGVEKKNWLTGLAQAIDPAIKDRTTLSETDAISIIKNNIGKIDNNVYNNYINKVLPSQYNSIASSNNKQEENKKLWQFRPDNINQFLQNSNNQTPTTQPSVSPTFTGVNPFVDIKALRLSPAVKKRRDEFLPFTSQNTPDVYGNPAYRESVFKDFEDRTGVKLNRANSDAINLEGIRNFQNQSTPELTKDYKLNFTRGNQDLYNEFASQKGYKKSKDNTKESNNFYDWATANKKLTKDYADSGKWGHEYYNTAPLDFETEAEYNKWRQDPDWEQVGNRFVDRSGDPNGVITYYDINKKWENKPAVKQPASDPVGKTQYGKLPPYKKQFEMPMINFAMPTLASYNRDSLNYYNTNPNFVDPRLDPQQARLNDIDRNTRTMYNNIGGRGTADLANLAQTFLANDAAKQQVYGDVYSRNTQEKARADQYNAGEASRVHEQNRTAFHNYLENPRRMREGILDTQLRTDATASINDMKKTFANGYQANYIEDTFHPGVGEYSWGSQSLDPNSSEKAWKAKVTQKFKEDQFRKQLEENTAKNGGKVKIKPKIKLGK